MHSLLFRLLTVGVGGLISLHLAMSGRVGAELTAVRAGMAGLAAANALFWAVGAITAWTAFFFLGGGSPAEYLAAAPKPLLSAGAIGASIVFAVSFLVPGRVGGAGAGFTCLVVGQVLMGLLLAHFGALGSVTDPFSLRKLAGVALVLAGAWLTQR
ncbi:DMT family transporter [Pendulispora albinea]|uniref:DMT family transporter n=1 Tax=Pendulispora albinea TaxID=2741071 RepID=A0ABZ2LZB9_9BACT